MARLTIFVSTIFLIVSLNTTRQDEDCPRGSMHCVRSSRTVLRCGKRVQCVRIRTPITHVTCGSTFTRLIVDPGHDITTSGGQIRMINDEKDKKEEPEVKWYPVVHEDNHDKHHNEHLPTTANYEESILGMLLIKTHQCSGGCGAHYHISYDSEGVRRRKNRQRLGRRRTFLRTPQGITPERPPGYQWGSMPNVGHL
ncbi:Hypothetical predicted protein [Mytilus galloprovincialis]|uniref:Secreted protein n=1 Tax=Mytilus galloprovincialis TaxID=29158 RepID=A0A8B6CMH2_MYTGA|nr:Hypothetical predicted protein [Mytilus galloprovincialis]